MAGDTECDGRTETPQAAACSVAPPRAAWARWALASALVLGVLALYARGLHLTALVLLGVAPLGFRWLVRARGAPWRVRRSHIGLALGTLLLVAVPGLAARTYFRYRTAEVM